MPERYALLLETVLIPGAEVVLHLMDQAGKELAYTCFEQKEPFGIVFCAERNKENYSNCAKVGCFAYIKNIDTDKNNTMVVQIEGRERFNIHAMHPQENGSYRVDYSILEDQSALLLNETSLFEPLHQLLGIYLETLAQIDPEFAPPLPEDLSRTDLTFFTLDNISIEEHIRQKGLEITSLHERVKFCIKLLNQEIARLGFLMEGIEDEEADFDFPETHGHLH